jgi:hypothetical protein
MTTSRGPQQPRRASAGPPSRVSGAGDRGANRLFALGAGLSIISTVAVRDSPVGIQGESAIRDRHRVPKTAPIRSTAFRSISSLVAKERRT